MSETENKKVIKCFKNVFKDSLDDQSKHDQLYNYGCKNAVIYTGNLQIHYIILIIRIKEW